MVAGDSATLGSHLTSKEKVSWMIDVLRASISLDWTKLATEFLTLDERKTITRRLMASSRALKEIKNTLWNSAARLIRCMNSDFHCRSPDLATIEICKAGWGPGLCRRRFHSEWWFQRHNRTLRISKDAARNFYHDILTTRAGRVPRRIGRS